MFSQVSQLVNAKTNLATVGSIAATAMVVRSVVRDILPREFLDNLCRGIVRGLFNRFSGQLTMVVDEFDGLVKNEIYEAVKVYLGAKISPAARRLKISKPEKKESFNITMEPNEEVTDIFNGVKFKWVWVCEHDGLRRFNNPRGFNSTFESGVGSYELKFNKKHKDMVIDCYLPYIVNQAMLTKHQKKTLEIFTVDHSKMYDSRRLWTPVNLDHPATFETLAMDTELKDMILKDLERFVKRKSHYRKVGKAWKRGYLLYGPPGTGKSSLIAAMANYLNFDIYDLELTDLRRNSDLRKLLVATANKSILVVEDIDCTIDLQNELDSRTSSFAREKEQKKERLCVTLSGLLNFIDGLWSSCGDERIIIFTTNHIEKLDPALLRPGRMDVHIHMSYCTPCGFKLLAANYLGLNQHGLFQEIEDLIQSTKVTPAEVAEQLLKCDEVDETLKGLIGFLHDKSKEIEESEARRAKEIDENKGTKQEDEIK